PNMSHPPTIKPDTDTKIERITKWKSAVGPSSLATLPAGHTNPRVSAMITHHSSNNVSIAASEYHCITESKPAANLPRANIPSLQVGLNKIVNRWKVPNTVNFAAYAKGYPTDDARVYAAQMLNDACKDWNALQLGVSFKWVTKIEDAAFVLAYGGDQGSTLARSFFPNDDDLSTVYVYKRAFEPGYVNYMKNVFLHELGHVLGLRHEFAPEQEGDTVQLGVRNEDSVMSYSFPPEMQKSDESSTKEFY
ncbi:hypothetical protein ASPWEDRAFT_74897, partial [Aspergillus wentii DTO 134E9]